MTTIRVYGDPAPQGSKRAWYNAKAGRAMMRESSGDKVATWRQDVIQTVIAATDVQHAGPVEMSAVFLFGRPKSHYGTGRNAATLKASAPRWVVEANKGDLDKLIRATGDALTVAGLLADDRLIVRLGACEKRYIDPGEKPGALLEITPLGDPHV